MNPCSPEGGASSEFVGARPASLIPSSFAHAPGVLVVPPDERLRLIRVDAKSAGKLKDLRQMVAAWEAAAEKCDIAWEEMVRLAVFRLEVERDLGTELAQTVRQGGDRSRSPAVTLPREGALPVGITKQQAAKYRALASIPDEAFATYVEKARDQRRVPSSAGARRFAAPALRAKSRKPAAGSSNTAIELPAPVLDAVRRMMTPDVCVGDASIGCSRRISAQSKRVFDELSGDVFVAECPDPGQWIRTLQQLRRQAKIQGVIVTLPAEVWAPWFRALPTDEWTPCFLEGVRSAAGDGVVLAYAGLRHQAFRLLFDAVGAVVPVR